MIQHNFTLREVLAIMQPALDTRLQFFKDQEIAAERRRVHQEYLNGQLSPRECRAYAAMMALTGGKL